jgi:hypothetical protein
MENKYIKISGLLGLVLLLSLLAALSFGCKERISGSKGDPDEATQYVCSMHPQVIRESPGDCPICGMLLIELIALDDNKYDSTLADIVRPVNASVLAAVRTVIPGQMSLPVVIEASGIVSYDPRKVQTISARYGGVIEKSFVRYQFQYIRQGDKIFEIFAPNIYDDRWNYVRLIQTYPDREDLTAEALEWFRLIGLSKGQIDTLKKTIRPDYYFAVYSPAEGYAVSLDFNPETSFSEGIGKEITTGGLSYGSGGVGLTDGKSVSTGDPLFRLADVKALLVELKVKTEEASLLKRGQKVTLSDPLFPGKLLTCDIDQVEPLNGGIFQSVRIYIRDNERILSPGRQVQASIEIGRRDGLWIPSSAVVNLGTRSIVMVRNDNKFIPVEVGTGIEADSKIEIVWGIEATSEIAEKALLLFDSDGFVSPGGMVKEKDRSHEEMNE